MVHPSSHHSEEANQAADHMEDHLEDSTIQEDHQEDIHPTEDHQEDRMEGHRIHIMILQEDHHFIPSMDQCLLQHLETRFEPLSQKPIRPHTRSTRALESSSHGENR